MIEINVGLFVSVLLLTRSLSIGLIEDYKRHLTMLAEGRKPLAAVLPEAGSLWKTIAVGINRFSLTVRDMIINLRKRSFNIAIGAAKMNNLIQTTSQRGDQQLHLAEEIFHATEDVQQSIADATVNVQRIADSNRVSVGVAQQSLGDMQNANSRPIYWR